MRLVSAVIDGVALAILSFVPVTILTLIGFPRIGVILGGLLALAYFSPEVLKAQSLGKMIFKFVITRQDGTPAPQDLLIKRYLYKMTPQILSIASTLPFLGFLSYVSMLALLVVVVGTLLVFRPEKLTLHDQLLGTAVYGPLAPTFAIPTTGAVAAQPPTTPVA